MMVAGWVGGVNCIQFVFLFCLMFLLCKAPIVQEH